MIVKLFLPKVIHCRNAMLSAKLGFPVLTMSYYILNSRKKILQCTNYCKNVSCIYLDVDVQGDRIIHI
jgi:hypothetical protein